MFDSSGDSSFLSGYIAEYKGQDRGILHKH